VTNLSAGLHLQLEFCLVNRDMPVKVYQQAK